MGDVELVPSPYAKYMAPPAPPFDTQLLNVVLLLNVNDVNDPGIIIEIQPPWLPDVNVSNDDPEMLNVDEAPVALFARKLKAPP